jgi:anti-anti-sigma factor
MTSLEGVSYVATTHAFHEALKSECSKKPRLLILDLSQLTFIGSWPLVVLVRTCQKQARDGSAFVMASPTPAVARILSLTKADQVIPVYGSVEEAAAR